MANIHRILAATDFSLCAAHVETRAAMLVSELESDALELLTVIDPSLSGELERMLKGASGSAEASLAEHSKLELKKTASRLQSENGIGCHYLVEFGRPAVQIASKADEVAADMIVVGAHGCKHISRFLVGNIPYKLLHTGKRPLLIVKNQPDRSYQNILVPVDFSECSKRAAQIALAIAPDANVTLLHGFEVPQDGLMNYAGVSSDLISSYHVEAKENSVQEMRRFISGLELGGRLVSSSVHFGYPPFVIQEYAEKFVPDLIVMGKHGKIQVEDILLGSVTRYTINETSCDILVAPSPQ